MAGTKDQTQSDKKEETKLSANAKKVMEMVEKMNVLELNDLVKALEDKFDVSASAPVMAGVMPTAGGNGGAGEDEAAEEQTEFDVILADIGTNKINVIKVVRELNQALGLVEAKNLVESTPKAVLEGAKKEVAEAAKKKFEEVGAKVELK